MINLQQHYSMNRQLNNFGSLKFSEESQITSIKKQLILQCQDSTYTQQFSVSIPYNSETRELDLGYILTKIFGEVLGIQGPLQVFYYNPQNNYYVYAGVYPFMQKILLDEEYIPLNFISILFKNVVVQPIPPVFHKKKRVIRTIEEALQKVGKWRSLHTDSNPKLTLQEAAKDIKIPKKTLDDYYYQIKLGEQYGFNFQANMGEKVGVLRKFVRENHKKKENAQELKILGKYLDCKNQSDEEDNEERQQIQDDQQE